MSILNASVLKFLVFLVLAVVLFFFTCQFVQLTDDERAALFQRALFSTTMTDYNNSALGPTVLCMIFTTPNKWSTRGLAVRRTWASRCHHHLFFYSQSAANTRHPIRQASDAVALRVPEGRNHLTAKTMAALKYSYEKYGQVVDWFLKADDDTYVIWENLVDFLRQQNMPSFAYIGRKLPQYLPHGYASGGAGYLITRRAVHLVLTKGRRYTRHCRRDGPIEDYNIGKCLNRLGVTLTDAVDEFGRQRFHSDNPLLMMDNTNTDLAKYYHIDINGQKIGCNKCDEMLSRRTVTMHYVTPGQMFMFDFLLYHLERSIIDRQWTLTNNEKTNNQTRRETINDSTTTSVYRT